MIRDNESLTDFERRLFDDPLETLATTSRAEVMRQTGWRSDERSQGSWGLSEAIIEEARQMQCDIDAHLGRAPTNDTVDETNEDQNATEG